MREFTPETMIEGFRQANPGLMFPGRRDAVPAQPYEAAVARRVPIERVLKAGGELASRFAHPDFIPFEKLFRKFPTAGIFSASPERKFEITLGSFQVPQGMIFALVDFRFDIYRLSGVAAGDFVPIEARRLSTQIGFDYDISDYRTANIEYQLYPTPAGSSGSGDPRTTAGIIAAGAEFNQTIPPQIGNPFFPPSAPPSFPTAADFAAARGSNVSSTGNIGTALMPQRHERLGPLPLPFTDYVRDSSRISFSAVAFNPVKTPIGFFEVDVTGILMPANVLDSLLKEMAPYTPQGAGPP